METKDGRNIEISTMTTQHLENAMHHLENRFMIPGVKSSKEFPEVPTLRLIPSQNIVDEYHEMKRVLSERILDKFHDETLLVANQKRLGVNPFEYI